MPATCFYLERMTTPLGELLLATDSQGLLRILDWEEHEDAMRRLLRLQYPGQTIQLQDATAESPAWQAVRDYFDGDLSAIERLEVSTGGTDFQKSVWAALRSIPAGQTISYLELATRIGRPKAVRAVGLANGSNPVSIVVPCHRVIGSKAALVGYGGGLPRKRWLLEHEKAISPQAAVARQAPLAGL